MKIEAQQTLAKTTATNSFDIAGKFEKFCKKIEGYRLLFLVLFIGIQGCIIVPVTIMTVSIIDIGLSGIAVGLLAANSFGILVTNMAETSIKSILFVSVFSFTSSIVIIGIHLFSIL